MTPLRAQQTKNQEAGEHVEERRLAGPVGSDHAVQDTGTHFEVHVRSDDKRAEALAEIGDRQHRVGRSGVSSDRGRKAERAGRGGKLSAVRVQRGEPTLGDAILDRIVHNAYRLELDGPRSRLCPCGQAKAKARKIGCCPTAGLRRRRSWHSTTGPWCAFPGPSSLLPDSVS